MNVSLGRMFDKYVLSLLVMIFGLFSDLFPNKLKTRKILVIKFWALGDSIVLLPTIHALRKKYPNSIIDVLVHQRNKDVFYENNDIDNLIFFNIWNLLSLFRRYDLCFDAEPFLNVSALIGFWSAPFRVGFSHGVRALLYQNKIEFTNKKHMVQNYLDLARSIGIKYDTDSLIKLKVSEEDKKKADEMLKQNGISSSDYIIGVSPGVAESAKTRMWPLDRVAKLADLIIEKLHAKVIFIDSPSNIKEVNQVIKHMKHKAVNLAGKTTVRNSFYLIEKCKILISNDTGPMHVGAAQGVKTIGLFGPNVPSLWAPYGKQNKFVYHPPWCSPCIINKKGLVPECYNKVYQQCMKNITVEDVFELVKKLK